MEAYNKHKKIAETEEVGKKIWQHLHFKVGIAILSIAAFAISFYTIYEAGMDKASPGKNVNASTLKVGAFYPIGTNETMPTLDQLKTFDTTVGHHLDIFLWYEGIGEDFYASDFELMAQDGRTIQLAWEPDEFGKGLDQPNYRLKTITAGYHDADIKRWADQLRDFRHEVIFRPMCEMNGNWTTWGVGNAVSGVPPVNGNQPSDYIPAWRHIHDIFVQEGATNVKFNWSPNVDGSAAEASYTFNTFYPGDAYVDYIGLDGYNWGTVYNTADWVSFWQTFEDVFNDSYDTFAVKTNKPFMISETASPEVGGSKANWITEAFTKLPIRFPRIQSLTWFNINKETDWRLNSSSASLTAFKNAMAGLVTQTPTSTTCTSFTYSAWGTCQTNGTQARTVLTSSPSGCTGGTPVTTQTCTYTPPPPTTTTCTSFTYSAWGACQTNNTQTRTVTSSSPTGCTGGSSVTTQSCTYTPTTTPDIIVPTVTITNPANWSTIGSNLKVNASASDNKGVKKMEVYLDGTLKKSNTSNTISWKLGWWKTYRLSGGAHTVTVKAYDAAGNVGKKTITVYK